MKSAEAGPVRPSGVLAHASQREAVTSESGERRDDTVMKGDKNKDQDKDKDGKVSK
ncbi:hypothetical protein Trisim1_000437 [Trichoderma cf. simile WF8]